MSSPRVLLAASILALGGCSGSVTFRSLVDFTADLDVYSGEYSRAMLVEGGGMTPPTLKSYPCVMDGTGDAYCQARVPADSELEMTCLANVCDPSPHAYVMDLGVQDLAALADPEVSVLDRVELLRVEANRNANTSNFDLPELSLFWASESASAAGLTATTPKLATIAAIPHGSTGPLDVTLNDVELDKLDEYVRNTSTKIRFFVRADIDLTPGQAIPTGRIAMTLGLIIRASGHLR